MTNHDEGITGGGARGESTREPRGIFGIVIVSGTSEAESAALAPRISAFIWGGKTRPTPTLPFGRWRGAA